MTESKREESLPDKYWLNPPGNVEDVVIIHVCDENRQVNRDFCCKRDILVQHMKYFESFLAENENGYDDIDISVHCDVEIFEWLMAYIHEPNVPPPLEKTIVVSILISSEFLQMDSLVDLCLEHIAQCLGDIIRLPIDLSCISEKLINRLASLTPPKVLAQTKDRKDKILNKLYKRRVEIDFSRKNVPRGSSRSIAASLTSCQFCGSVYLDNCVSNLVCKTSVAAVDFRGKLVRRHQAIIGWSLTAYLKALHAGGMSWEAIYWHVWGACVVLQADDAMISALESDRYQVEADGILFTPRGLSEQSSSVSTNIDDSLSLLPSNSKSLSTTANRSMPPLPPPLTFSLDIEDDLSMHAKPIKMVPSFSPLADLSPFDTHITASLNPNRPPSILTSEIFELISSQYKLVTSVGHKNLIEQTAKAQLSNANANSSNNNTNNANSSNVGTDNVSANLDGFSQSAPVRDFYEILWGNFNVNAQNDNAANNVMSEVVEEEVVVRGRSLSPGRAYTNSGTRRGAAAPGGGGGGATSTSKGRQGNVSSGSGVGEGGGDALGGNNDAIGSGGDGTAQGGIRQPSPEPERGERDQKERQRSRSSSVGNRRLSAKGSLGGVGGQGTRKAKSTNRRKTETVKDAEAEAEVKSTMDALLTFPPDVKRQLKNLRGPFYGVWTSTHPLQLHPTVYHDLIQSIQESNLSEARRLEWELDVVRDYDERRFDRFEAFLVSCRDHSMDTKRKALVAEKLKSFKKRAEEERVSKTEYYRDRGRQPHTSAAL